MENLESLSGVDENKQVFEMFIDGYMGPSSFYYINKMKEEYEFRYGFSSNGLKIRNDPNNKELYIRKQDKEFYENFKSNLIQLTSHWSKDGYSNNQIMGGTQWHIDLKNTMRYSGSNAFPEDFKIVMNYIDKAFGVDQLII